MRRYLVCASAFLCAFSSGCWQFRGIPAHGGGKRFDEEQRVVVGSVRRTIASMMFEELKGKRTRIVLASPHTSGGGTINWGGLQSITGYTNLLDRQEYWLRRLAPAQPDDTIWREQFDDTKDIEQTTDYLNFNYRPRHSYRAATQNTEKDLQYFRAALEMRMRHTGIPIVGQKPEAILFVLVDVLGTNRSRKDLFIYSSDELLCSCEVTYYALDVKTGKLLFEARQNGSRAIYREQRVLFVPHSRVRRKVLSGKAYEFDVDGMGIGPGEPGDVPEAAEKKEKQDGEEPMSEEDKQKLLESLREKALFHIESGNPKQAREYVDLIVDIDPGYEGLTEVKQKLTE